MSKRTSCCPHFWLTASSQLMKVCIHSSNLYFYSYIRQQPTSVSCLILKKVVKVADIFHPPALALWTFLTFVLATGKYVLLFGLFGFLTIWIVKVSGTVSLLPTLILGLRLSWKNWTSQGVFQAWTLQTEVPLLIHILLTGTRKRKEL